MTGIFSNIANLLNLSGDQQQLPAGFIGAQQPAPPERPSISSQISKSYQKVSEQPGFNNALFKLGATLLAARENNMGLGESLLAGQDAFNSQLNAAKKAQAEKAAALLELQKFQTDTAFKLGEAQLNQQKLGLEERKFGNETGKTAEELNLKRQELGLKFKEFEKKYENGGLTPEEQFNRATKLRGEFTTASKDFVTQRDAFAKIQTAASDPSAAGDISLVYGFMKLNDPTSTVREGEFATAQNAGAVPERVRAAYNKAVNGERLADSVRKDFVNTSGRLYKTSENQHKKLVDQYTGLAKKVGADPTQVALDSEIVTPPQQTPIPGQVPQTGFKFLGFK